MKRLALFFDRTYIDAHHCFVELANQLAKAGFGVDLYMVRNAANYQPFFENQQIRILSFPRSKFELLDFWYQIRFSNERRYAALIGTPVEGVWLAYRVAKIQKVPYYYLADELVEHIIVNSPKDQQVKLAYQNRKANRHAKATIALGENRYRKQVEFNHIDYPHEHFVIPNAAAGQAIKLRSNYFRDIFNINDQKPILLFAGTLQWSLAKRVYEETKGFSNRDYHLIFHGRTLGLMGEGSHPFIKISSVPLPYAMINYAFSSADIGLALYNKEITQESMNCLTGGKIGTYLKNELPLIAGNDLSLQLFQKEGVGIFWDGETPFDDIANKAIGNMNNMRMNIPSFYRHNLQYEFYFENFKKHLEKSII